MKCRKIGVGRPDESEFEICNPLAGSLVSNLYRGVDYQTTDIMHRAVTFSRIAGDIVNALSHESLSKFCGEPDKKVKLPIENGRVCRAVRKTTVNTTQFRSGLIDYLCS